MVTINGVKVDGRKVNRAIRRQPGYSGEGSYMIAKATTGGYRLYKAIGHDWLDASLADSADLGALL